MQLSTTPATLEAICQGTAVLDMTYQLEYPGQSNSQDRYHGLQMLLTTFLLILQYLYTLDAKCVFMNERIMGLRQEQGQ